MKKIFLSYGIALVFCLQGCRSASPMVSIQTSETFQPAKYSSFLVRGPSSWDESVLQPERTDKTIRSAVSKNLVQKGYICLEKGKADVTVEFRGQLDMKRDAAAVLRMYGKKASQDKIDSGTIGEGSLVIDVVDSQTSRLVLRAYAFDAIDKTASWDEKSVLIKGVVDKSLVRFMRK